MDNLKRVYKILVLAVFALFSLNVAEAQNSKKEKEKAEEAAVAKMIAAKNFVFVAEYVNPAGGRSIFLNPGYDVRVSGDTLATFLPYFGRAYTAPINPAEGGFKFTSSEFDYIVEAKRKGWDLTVQPKDANDVTQMFLRVTKSGHATLQVLSNNRQAISFNGYITQK